METKIKYLKLELSAFIINATENQEKELEEALKIAFDLYDELNKL